MGNGIERIELKYIAAAGLVGYLWVSYGQRIVEWAAGQTPLAQFATITLGTYFTLLLFSRGISQRNYLKYSIAFVLIFIGSDILMPEYHVDWDGTLIGGSILAQASSDYALGWAYLNYLHVPQASLPVLIYVVTPVMALLIAAYLLKPKEFTRAFRR